jgi:hypothetical protein
MNKKRKSMEIIPRNISFLLLFLSPFLWIRGIFFSPDLLLIFWFPSSTQGIILN